MKLLPSDIPLYIPLEEMYKTRVTIYPSKGKEDTSHVLSIKRGHISQK